LLLQIKEEKINKRKKWTHKEEKMKKKRGIFTGIYWYNRLFAKAPIICRTLTIFDTP